MSISAFLRFYGFKLYLVVNKLGQLLNVILTPGTIDDRQPIGNLLSELFGKIFGVSVREASCREAYRRYRGYVSHKLAAQLLEDFRHSIFCQTSSQHEKPVDASS